MRQAVATRLEQLGQAAEAEVLAGLERHRDLLLAWNHSAHLISRADQSPARLVRHYLDSIEAVPLLPTQGPLVDVGSGGGFPGLIWSLLRPRQKVVLVEREARKAAFLRDAAQQLSLDRLTVEQEQISRPEQLMARKAAVLTSRA
ncbi:MAG: 16S rRNA (guanine(527)-N(7))-methyltransferase RsmG, partial [Acidobacteriota bacterium]